MNARSALCAIVLVLTTQLWAASSPKTAPQVILDENAVKNLRIQTVEAEETDFEQTVFALGRIQPIPERRAVVASRIAGRIVEIQASLGTLVEAGSRVARLESRQPGEPPPSVWLNSPNSGLVTACETRLGEPVDPDKVIMEITDLAEVYAVAKLPEHLAGKLKQGAIAHITVSALPGEPLEGTLLRFGTSADKATGTIDAIFNLPNPGLLLRPDMRAEFSVVLDKREAVMSVPRAALQGDALNRFVYVRDYGIPNAFVKVFVQTGAMNDRFVEITSGLIPGDEVVTTGAYSLAFAGKGSISLKEALDAAHGHEHNEDGSEIKEGQKTSHQPEQGEKSTDQRPLSPVILFSLSSNTLLLILLVLAMRRKTHADGATISNDVPR